MQDKGSSNNRKPINSFSEISLTDELTRLKTAENIVFSDSNQDKLAGDFNQVFFGVAKGVKQNNGAVDSEKSVEIASSQAKDKAKTKAFVDARQNAVELLRENEIKSPFVQNFIYLEENGTKKISTKANKDLSHYMLDTTTPRISDPCVMRDLLAQLVLAVHALHAKNLVHRDIKPANILVFIDQEGKLQLQLADLDTVEKYNNPKVKRFGTPGYMAPELSMKDICDDSIGYGAITLKEQRNKRYKEANKKALDCYALGVSIHKLVEELYTNTRDKQKFIDFANGLMDEDHTHRTTIEAARNNDIFGQDNPTRDEYFQEIEKKYVKDVYFDDYYLKSGYTKEIHESFYLLPKSLKEVVFTASNLQNKWDSLSRIAPYSELFQPMLEATKKEVEQLQAVLKKMETSTSDNSELQNKISKNAIDGLTEKTAKMLDIIDQQTKMLFIINRKLDKTKPRETKAQHLLELVKTTREKSQENNSWSVIKQLLFKQTEQGKAHLEEFELLQHAWNRMLSLMTKQHWLPSVKRLTSSTHPKVR